MRILVDADACPVKPIILEQAKKKQIPVIMLIDDSHVLNDGYSTVITVDQARDSVDLKLINLLASDDLVITQDYGVAALALGKGAKVLHQDGFAYTNDNIDQMLFERHMSAKTRRGGGKTHGMKKRTKQQDRAFAQALEQVLRDL